jgi:hypothetical protein
MDPVSLIVTALVTGALGGLQIATERTVVEVHASLRDRLVARFGLRAQHAVQALESDPYSPETRARVEAEFRRMNVGQDDELVRLARELEVLVAGISRPVIVGVSAARRNPRREAAGRALERVLDAHVGKVLAVRNTYRVDDRDLLTRNLRRRGDIPSKVKDGLVELHADMREIITRTAELIETQKYHEVEQVVVSAQLSAVEQERATELVSADRRMNVSFESLRMVVDHFGGINRKMLARIDGESQMMQANIMLGNAILVYELADFLIEYIQDFTVDGVDSIAGLHADARRQIEEARDADHRLAAQAHEPRVSESRRARLLQNIENRRDALQLLEQEWDNYLTEVEAASGAVLGVRENLPDLELTRANAENQIRVLQMVSLLRFLRETSEFISGAVETLQGFELAPLTTIRVRRLLGLDQAVP